jgi:hypothetical protein
MCRTVSTTPAEACSLATLHPSITPHLSSPLPHCRLASAPQALQRKAEERNPDEFYFAMEKARTKGGVHKVGTAEQNKYSQEELRLMRTQDEKYLALKSRMEEEVGGQQSRLILWHTVQPQHQQQQQQCQSAVVLG